MLLQMVGSGDAFGIIATALFGPVPKHYPIRFCVIAKSRAFTGGASDIACKASWSCGWERDKPKPR